MTQNTSTTDLLSNELIGIHMDRIKLGWWNTSLSPVGRNRADQKHEQISRRIVQSLIEDLEVDCLALGEVSESDLIALKESCQNPTLAVFDGTLRNGRLQFDTGIIYNGERLSIVNSSSITSSHGNRNHKIANRVDFRLRTDNSIIHVFVSHWPSRAVTEENVLTRETIANRLKEQIKQVQELTPNAAIVVLGDFNDEPFDTSLSWHLLATRDRELAKSKNGYLYNPFWRQMGETQPHNLRGNRSGAAGTCYYRAGTATRWRTFDQILFSASFLGQGNWHLCEEETQIVESDYLLELVQNEDVYFDHLPVLSVIEKFKQNP